MSVTKIKNFKLRSLKILKGSIKAEWEETFSLGSDITTTEPRSASSKDDPSINLKAAMDAFNSIVAYDEGYSEKVTFHVTGVSVDQDAEKMTISHVKELKSGGPGRSSGAIHLESEEFAKAEEAFEMVKELEIAAYDFFMLHKRDQLEMFEREEVSPDFDAA